MPETQLSFLRELSALLALAMVVLVVCYRLKLPAIVGFLLSGILAGPTALSIVSSQDQIEVMAEVGVVLLLFIIGAEFSVKQLLQIRRMFFTAGAIQMGLVTGCTMLFSRARGIPLQESLLFGLLIALSSTAVVLKLLRERADLDAPHGRIAFSVLLFQDLAVVPVMLFLPLLSPSPESEVPSAGQVLGNISLVGAAVFVAGRWLVPFLLKLVVATRDRELFLLSVIVIVFSVAFLSQSAGLSLALGALLAGLVISESEFSHQALGNVLPFQQLFTTLFFISAGMLLDLNFVVNNIGHIVGLTAAVVVGKFICTIPAGLALGFSFRTAALTAISLAQVGEFSLVVAQAGAHYKILAPEVYQLFLATFVLSVACTPLMIQHAPRLVSLLERLPIPQALRRGWMQSEELRHVMGHPPLSGHLLVIGFGMNGRAVAQAAQSAKIPFSAIESNPQRVKSERQHGMPVVYGDATQEALLLEEGAARARVVVIAISDAVATRRIIALIRAINTEAHIIVRTRLVDEIIELHRLGAQDVIAEEFESAVEVVGRVLARYLCPRDEIERFIEQLRAGGYHSIRQPAYEPPSLTDLKLHAPQIEVLSYRIAPLSPLTQKTLAEAAFRNRYGVTLLAIRRGTEVIPNPSGETVLQTGDILVLLGPARNREALEVIFGEKAP